MKQEIHANHVLYKSSAAKIEYRQIVVVGISRQFQVRIFGGTVVQLEPRFMVKGNDAEAYLHTTLKSALDDAEKKFQQTVDGSEWHPYHPVFPSTEFLAYLLR
jgi:hypothetical protein